VGSFKGGFQRALKEAGVLLASDEKKRVPYSLRHTYATMRLAEGVSVFQLAANMGTSVEMLEDFYGKKRMRDPKMATELTKLWRREDADQSSKQLPRYPGSRSPITMRMYPNNPTAGGTIRWNVNSRELDRS
jgi:hypothetical protein